MRKHKHKILEVITLYKQDMPTKVELVKCSKCNVAFPELREFLQDREDKTWEAYGHKSPVIFLSSDMDWVEEKKFTTKEEITNN